MTTMTIPAATKPAWWNSRWTVPSSTNDLDVRVDDDLELASMTLDNELADDTCATCGIYLDGFSAEHTCATDGNLVIATDASTYDAMALWLRGGVFADDITA